MPSDKWTIANDPGRRPLATGTQIGSYRIEAQLGEGGMGVVYRALDTKLNRPVAIKLLSNELADADARRRFQREAQMASSLNHPHILTVHDVGEFDGRQYLVTEYVDGGTLKDWASGARRTWRQIVDLLVGVADGLAAAHAAGILHRDIKPANILVARNGYAKLADFGLAKLEERTSPSDLTRTSTQGPTRPGMIVGSIAYMSPEQASGRPLDARSDIFSFGVVLYEILTGQRPFGGATDLEVLKELIHGAPRPIGTKTPVPLRMVVEKALERDPAERYQSIRELVVDLRRALRRSSAEAELAPGISAPRASRRPGWVLATAMGLAAGLAAYLVPAALTRRAPAQMVSVQRLTDLVGLEESPAFSPDGKTVAFAAVSGGRRQIWVRLLAGGLPLAITKDDLDHYGPRWSPDSASLIYYTPPAQPGEPGTLWEVPALGGSARRLLATLGPGDISHDGKSIAFFRFRDGAAELTVAARDLSTTRSIARLPASYDPNLRWSPDDRLIAFLTEHVNFSNSLMVVEASGGVPREVAQDSLFEGFTWIPDGSGLIASSAQGSTMSYPPTQNLWVFPLAGGTASQLTFGESSYQYPDAGAQGNLVVSRLRAQSDVWKFPITGDPVENAQRGTRVTRQTGPIQTLSVSPDETEVAFLSDNGGHANVWIARIADGEMRPLTYESDPRVVVAVPYWAPRGGLINFLSNRNSVGSDRVNLWVAKPDGSDLRDLGLIGAWTCWSGDGRWLYYSVRETGIHYIRKVPVGGGQPVTVRDDDAIGCAVASDGSALYYLKILTQATGAGDFEIRVAKPENGPSTVIGRVSGSRIPVDAFNVQGYLSPDGKWLAMPLMDGSTSNLWALPATGGEWKKLTDFSPRNVVIARRIGWSNDGKSLYASVGEVDSDIVMLTGLRW